MRVSMFLLRYLPHCDFERDQVRALDALCASATTDAAGHAEAVVVLSIAASASCSSTSPGRPLT
ncbi:MAG TPA: hypothetical protein VGO83_04605, partial [Thermoleophilaceae bacterium]|nr:hypothetical protein [Thermoleophilaceae bacterium]